MYFSEDYITSRARCEEKVESATTSIPTNVPAASVRRPDEEAKHPNLPLDVERLLAENKRLREDNARLREALNKYADGYR